MAAEAALLVGFRDLFEGRPDAYGLGGKDGGSVKQPPLGHVWEGHLTRLNGAIGIYPLRDDLTVKWGCTDIDTGDTLTQARNLQRVLQHLGVVAHVERSRSKGHHVWVFADGWCPAEDMRRMLLVAHEVAGAPPTEVNPKQTTLEQLAKGLGNYVRLPYPYALGQGYQLHADSRQVVLNGWNDPISLGAFLDEACGAFTPIPVIAGIANLYVPPPPRQTVAIEGTYQGDLEPLRQRLGGLANRIFLEGPLQARDGKQGRDRSGTLSRLAILMLQDGLSPAEALALLRDADLRWGKFFDRPDGEDQLARIIEWAGSQA